MRERQPTRVSGPRVPADRVKPPWWLITSWLRWGWFMVLYPGVMGYFAIDRVRQGRGSGALDHLFIVGLFVIVVVGLIQVTLTLLAYRHDPTLRTREWPGPPPGPGVSRRVWVTIMVIAIAAIALVLLLYAGWQGALFAVAVLAGLGVLFVRFDLFADDPSRAPESEPSPRIDRDGGTRDR